MGRAANAAAVSVLVVVVLAAALHCAPVAAMEETVEEIANRIKRGLWSERVEYNIHAGLALSELRGDYEEDRIDEGLFIDLGFVQENRKWIAYAEGRNPARVAYGLSDGPIINIVDLLRQYHGWPRLSKGARLNVARVIRGFFEGLYRLLRGSMEHHKRVAEEASDYYQVARPSIRVDKAQYLWCSDQARQLMRVFRSQDLARRQAAKWFGPYADIKHATTYEKIWRLYQRHYSAVLLNIADKYAEVLYRSKVKGDQNPRWKKGYSRTKYGCGAIRDAIFFSAEVILQDEQRTLIEKDPEAYVKARGLHFDDPTT